MSNSAIVTTTINNPEDTFRELAKAGQLIVAGDLKTPRATENLVRKLGGTYLDLPDQKDWLCSEKIGWNSIQRRNIAFLEAARQGFETIVTVDDDNCPEDAVAWLAAHEKTVGVAPERVATTDALWFNPGSLLEPPVWARGMPYTENTYYDANLVANVRETDPEDDYRVAVSAGLWLGDPDIDALQRITRSPKTLEISRQCPVAVEPGTWSPINSQNTMWARDFLPLAVVWPHVGRWDDIFGGYAAQWSFWQTGHVVSYGEPTVWQDRNDHDLWVDLGKEINGLRDTETFIEILKNTNATGDPLRDMITLASSLEKNRGYFGGSQFHGRYMDVADFLRAWVTDWESIA